MLVDFNSLDNSSRIWIYASEKKFTDSQESYILNSITNHLKNWEAHKKPLTAAVSILEHHFIIIALNESINDASGCSIDSLYNIIIEIELELSICLMNRQNVFCRVNDIINCFHSSQLMNNVTKETLFYDLTIQKKSDLSHWLKPIKSGWCNRLFE